MCDSTNAERPGFTPSEKTVGKTFDTLFEEHKNLPMLCIGRDSYIEETQVEAGPDQDLLYSIQVGRYSSIARDTKMIIDLNHDYKRVCQGRISGVVYQRPHLIRRKGQVIIMNDCWIGNGVIMLGGIKIGNGAVVAGGGWWLRKMYHRMRLFRESGESDRIPVRAGADCCTQ